MAVEYVIETDVKEYEMRYVGVCDGILKFNQRL